MTFAEGIVMPAGSVANMTNAWLALGRREGDAVVNVASVAGNINGGGAQAWYPSAKAAIAGFTRHLALRRPGGMRANGRAGRPDDVGATICFLLRPAASYINGVVLPVDGGGQITT